jgi:iron-sulfur cluster repair protein YtfE (RIC family)
MIANPHASTEHHARLAPHVDRLVVTADLIGTAPAPQVRAGLDEACAFLTGLLLPHMEAAERALYPELERLMQNRHSMTPMRREHQEIRALVADLEHRRTAIGDHPLSTGDSIALRRGLFRLFGLLKVHLAEEQLYANIVEHGLSADEAAALAAALEHDRIGAA